MATYTRRSRKLVAPIGRMKVSYNQQSDILSVILRDDVAVAESDEDKPGVSLDYDTEGNLVSLEILDASRRVTEAQKVDFQLTTAEP